LAQCIASLFAASAAIASPANDSWHLDAFALVIRGKRHQLSRIVEAGGDGFHVSVALLHKLIEGRSSAYPSRT